MTIQITRLDGKSGAGTSLVSNSINPGDGKIVFAFVAAEFFGGAAGDPTLSGGGLTWHVEANNAVLFFGAVGLRHKLAWAYTGTGAGAFAVTANFGASSHNIWLILDKLTEADISGPVAQTAFASSVSSLALNVAFAADMARGNGAWAGMNWVPDSVTVAAGEGYTLLTPGVTLSTVGTAQTEWRPGPDLSPNADAVPSSAVPWLMTGVEVKAALIGGGHRVEGLGRGSGEKLRRSMESLGRTRLERF